jgi:hypothetical protein
MFAICPETKNLEKMMFIPLIILSLLRFTMINDFGLQIILLQILWMGWITILPVVVVHKTLEWSLAKYKNHDATMIFIMSFWIILYFYFRTIFSFYPDMNISCHDIFWFRISILQASIASPVPITFWIRLISGINIPITDNFFYILSIVLPALLKNLCGLVRFLQLVIEKEQPKP